MINNGIKEIIGDKSIVLIVISFSFLFSGCTGSEKESNQKLANQDNDSDLIVLDTTNIPYDIELIKQVVFESNEEVFLDGYIGEIAVDENGRVYITATKMGVVGIYVFEPNGSFITKFGQEGRGPGEFEAIGSISIYENKLYVFGPRLQKFGVFSLDDYELIKDQIIRRDSIPKHDELARILRVNELQVTESGEIVAKMSNLSMSKENEITKIRYHKISDNGYILPDRILELEKFHFYFGKNEPYPVLMPFSRNSLLSVMSDGSFYTAWSEDFLIKKYDENGNYLKSFHFPYKNAPLSISGISLNDTKRKILDENDVPDTWQALHTIETDEKNRLWVSTITESDSTFQWWVLNEEGDVLARFDKPRKRSEISVMSKPLYKIKNGYFYDTERDEYGGAIRVIKYKIEFLER